jgi:hypothetical protein
VGFVAQKLQRLKAHRKRVAGRMFAALLRSTNRPAGLFLT